MKYKHDKVEVELTFPEWVVLLASILHILL